MFKKSQKEEKVFESEDPVKLNVKPIVHKNLFTTNEPEENTKNSRVKALQMMRNKKYSSVNDLNQNLYSNDKDSLKKFEIHKNIYHQEEQSNDKEEIPPINSNKNLNMFVLDKFEQYYNDKIADLHNYNIETQHIEQPISLEGVNNSNKFKLELKYTMGFNSNSKDSMCFHKQNKWVAYLNRNLVIIESFDLESDRPQIILKDSKSFLNTIKISENGWILMAFSKKFDALSRSTPEIFFWDCKKTGFTLINKTAFKHKIISDAEISTQNNFCAVLSGDTQSETFVSILDFFHNEVLATTVMTIPMISIKWNKFLSNLEFCTLSEKIYTFWRLDSNVRLQYQLGDFNEKLIEMNTFTCIDYSPPLSCNCNVLLLLGLSNGEIWGVDTKTNSLATKFKVKQESITRPISYILCTIHDVTVISSNVIRYYKLPWIRNMKYDDLNIFVNKEDCLELDSDIIAFDLDMSKSCVNKYLKQGLAMTEKGVLWYLDYKEKVNIRIHANLTEESDVVQIKLINKDYYHYAIRKIDFEKQELEEVNSNARYNEYYLLTGHKNGQIRLWTIPEYSILMMFDSVTEELVGFETSPNEPKLVAFYSTGTIRFFDLAKSKFLGKYRALSNEHYRFLRFLPDGRHIFLVDSYGTFLLMKVEKWEPIAIQLHQLFNLSGDMIQFSLSPIEQYNKFLVNLSNVYLNVYSRKYTNLLKNLEYDNSVPQFSLMDKFNVEDYLKHELKVDQYDNVENFTMEFSSNERSLVYILSQARKVLLIRHYEHHQNLKQIFFKDSHPIDFSIAPDSSFVIYTLKDSKLQISNLNTEKGVVANYLLDSKEKLRVSISSNGKLVIVGSENSLAAYLISVE